MLHDSLGYSLVCMLIYRTVAIGRGLLCLLHFKDDLLTYSYVKEKRVVECDQTCHDFSLMLTEFRVRVSESEQHLDTKQKRRLSSDRRLSGFISGFGLEKTW